MARDCGVDALFVEAPQSLDELDAIAAALPGIPLVANMVEAGRTPLLTPQELAARGFRFVITPVGGLFAATKALRDAYGVLRSAGTLRDHLDRLVAFDDFTAIVGLPAISALERTYAS
jgi:methylisocitrate lyase